MSSEASLLKDLISVDN